ncbi:MAG: hypothetical protein WC812_03735 [Candidatus Pacearchaeota archaeon]|jgi:hypothetical protein
MDEEIYKKIIQKKEFSQIPRLDIELTFSKFDKSSYLTEEKIKLTRDLLRKVYSVFSSQKLLILKEKNPEWFLKKHISTKERFDFYPKLYDLLLKNFNNKINIIDLGCGVNGFSYYFFKKRINYVGVEAIGQLVNLQNEYFKKNKLNAICYHESLFNLEKIKKIISSEKGNNIIFLFKVLDSLEMLKRDYSKEILKEIVNSSSLVIVSFATQSLISKKKFQVNRNWILQFIKDNFNLIDDFELGNERYICFNSK